MTQEQIEKRVRELISRLLNSNRQTVTVGGKEHQINVLTKLKDEDFSYIASDLSERLNNGARIGDKDSYIRATAFRVAEQKQTEQHTKPAMMSKGAQSYALQANSSNNIDDSYFRWLGKHPEVSYRELMKSRAIKYPEKLVTREEFKPEATQETEHYEPLHLTDEELHERYPKTNIEALKAFKAKWLDNNGNILNTPRRTNDYQGTN